MKFGMRCPKRDEVCVFFILNGAAGLKNSQKASLDTENSQELLEALAGRQSARLTHLPVHSVVAAFEFLISHSLLSICSPAESKVKAEVWPAGRLHASA